MKGIQDTSSRKKDSLVTKVLERLESRDARREHNHDDVKQGADEGHGNCDHHKDGEPDQRPHDVAERVEDVSFGHG